MRFLWLFLILPAVIAQAGFGTSYLKNSRLCHEWSCLNTKLGLPDTLPPKEQLSAVLKSLLPQGSWQNVTDGVIDVCYGDRPRRYTNTCPGQALLHCVVDQLINTCPEEYQRKNDACSPVSSLAGLKYMFSQSYYENMQSNLPVERRPSWFLMNYFSSKCCNLPRLFDSALLSQCGFHEFLNNYTHTPKYQNYVTNPSAPSTVQPADIRAIEDQIQNMIYVKHVKVSPLECCDMSEFIARSWPAECNLHLSWDAHKRLVVKDDVDASTTTPPTTPVPTRKSRDRMLVPLSCEKETCIFQKLNIVNESGSVDIEAFTKLLDNFTDAHQLWIKAKARVLTTCLKRPLTEYDGDCEINKILACTLDVLTENCPYTAKSDICKHSKEDIVCQISSSKYRAKNRRTTCYLPDLVHPEYLRQCGATSLSRTQHVSEVRTTNTFKWPSMKYNCIQLTNATKCLMNKMGVINKYGFMGHFLMKDRIRTTSEQTWDGLIDFITSAFISSPHYNEYCDSPKKLLNVVDAMIMTCPASRRTNSSQCNQLFREISNTAPANNMTLEKLQGIMNHFQHVYLPTRPRPIIQFRPFRKERIVKTPLYDFGILGSQNAPPVNVIDLKTTTHRPSAGLLLPVYLRPPVYRTNYIFTPYRRTPVFRNAPLWTRAQIPTPAVPYMFNGPLTPFNTPVLTTPTTEDATASQSTTEHVRTNDETSSRAVSQSGPYFDDSALDRAARM